MNNLEQKQLEKTIRRAVRRGVLDALAHLLALVVVLWIAWGIMQAVNAGALETVLLSP